MYFIISRNYCSHFPSLYEIWFVRLRTTAHPQPMNPKNSRKMRRKCLLKTIPIPSLKIAEWVAANSCPLSFPVELRSSRIDPQMYFRNLTIPTPINASKIFLLYFYAIFIEKIFDKVSAQIGNPKYWWRCSARGFQREWRWWSQCWDSALKPDIFTRILFVKTCIQNFNFQ